MSHHPPKKMTWNAEAISGAEAKWEGPYLKKAIPLDPWGNAYVFKLPGEHGDYDLLSLGKDGQPGGEGEAADITNW